MSFSANLQIRHDWSKVYLVTSQSEVVCSPAPESVLYRSAETLEERESCNRTPHLFLAYVFNTSDEREVKSNTETVLQEQRRTTAVQLPFRNNRHSITEKISFIHVVCGEDHCPA